jgi:hypothetical protein
VACIAVATQPAVQRVHGLRMTLLDTVVMSRLYHSSRARSNLAHVVRDDR